jgi:hypothetical protein
MAFYFYKMWLETIDDDVESNIMVDYVHIDWLVYEFNLILKSIAGHHNNKKGFNFRLAFRCIFSLRSLCNRVLLWFVYNTVIRKQIQKSLHVFFAYVMKVVWYNSTVIIIIVGVQVLLLLLSIDYSVLMV